MAVEQVEVTLEEGTNLAAAVSPDGAIIVIDLQGTIWRLPITGGTAKALTDALGDARQPAFSPDGKRIAFQSYRDGNWHLWTVSAEGRILGGTDFLPYGVGLHTELQRLVDAGLSPYQALQTVSLHAAEALGAGEDLGSIEAGKLADIVIVDGNPLEDIRNARRVRTVIKNGEVYELEDLLKRP